MFVHIHQLILDLKAPAEERKCIHKTSAATNLRENTSEEVGMNLFDWKMLLLLAQLLANCPNMKSRAREMNGWMGATVGLTLTV